MIFIPENYLFVFLVVKRNAIKSKINLLLEDLLFMFMFWFMSWKRSAHAHK